MQVLDRVETELRGVVRDVMVEQIVTVLPKTSVVQVSELVAENNARHAIVTDTERRVLGVVSQRDLLKHFLQSLSQNDAISEPDTKAAAAPWEVGSLIERKPVTIPPDLPLAKAALVFSSCKICCLPVVDPDGMLLGSVTISDLLRHLSGSSGPVLENEFQVFKPAKESKPKTPAFFRRSNGALVIPLVCLDDVESIPGFAMLGYDGNSGRILVRLVADAEEGARKVYQDNEQIVIPASDFVAHFDIKFHGSAFEVTKHARTGCLILSPKQQTPRPAPAPAEPAKV